VVYIGNLLISGRGREREREMGGGVIRRRGKKVNEMIWEGEAAEEERPKRERKEERLEKEMKRREDQESKEEKRG
jgi:hypothetical protein